MGSDQSQVLADVWFRSFLFRATFIFDVVFCQAMVIEIHKRLKTFNGILAQYEQNIADRLVVPSVSMIRKLRRTHMRLRSAIKTFDDIIAPGMIVWFAFFVLYSLSDINNFLANGGRQATEDGATKSVLLLVRVAAVALIFHVSISNTALVDDEARRTVDAVQQISTKVSERDLVTQNEVNMIKLTN